MTDTKFIIQRLESLMAEGFSAEGSGLEAKVRKIERELPDDLRDLLLNLDHCNREVESGENDSLEFAFLCGQAYGRLENLLQTRLAENLVYHAPDGSPPLELEKNDFDTLARFVVLRDQLLKTVADYTLKFLLVSAILLFIGLSLGLI